MTSGLWNINNYRNLRWVKHTVFPIFLPPMLTFEILRFENSRSLIQLLMNIEGLDHFYNLLGAIKKIVRRFKRDVYSASASVIKLILESIKKLTHYD